MSWGDWSEWGDCMAISTQCDGRGQRVRHRLCPGHGHQCPAINTPTVDYTSCNATCIGKRSFTCTGSGTASNDAEHRRRRSAMQCMRKIPPYGCVTCRAMPCHDGPRRIRCEITLTQLALFCLNSLPAFCDSSVTGRMAQCILKNYVKYQIKHYAF